MPTYEFHCERCGNFEDMMTCAERESSKGKMVCPGCGGKVEDVWRPPAIMTATRRYAGQGTLLDQFGDTPEGREQLEMRVNLAKKKYGYTPNRNDIYDPTVAPAPGHPLGFIPHDDPAGHIRRACTQLGVGCDTPILKIPDPGPQPVKKVPLAEDLIKKRIKQHVAADPALATKSKHELREMVIDKHGYKGNGSK